LGLLSDLTSIHLQMNNLSGAIPSQLGLLTQLTELWLNENNLTGSLPAELDRLTALIFLILANNTFSGALSSLLDTAGVVERGFQPRFDRYGSKRVVSKHIHLCWVSTRYCLHLL
jgi:hypothetical protein